MNNRPSPRAGSSDPKFHPIHVARIPLDRDLGYRSKLDRRPEFLHELKEYGKTKSRWFLQERESKNTPWRRSAPSHRTRRLTTRSACEE